MKLITLISPTLNMAQLQLICQPQDAILLRQDAVYLCRRPDLQWPQVALYVLATDASARQLNVPDTITAITETQWLNLTITAEQNLLWQN